MLRSIVGIFLLTSCLSAADPSPALQVIRLKPGETKSVELALGRPGYEFRPKKISARDFLDVSLMTTTGFELKETPIKVKDNSRYEVTSDFTVVWSSDKPELEFHAGKDMKKGTTDLRMVYRSFGGGDHVAGFRVIVE